MIKGVTHAHLAKFRTFRCSLFSKPVTGHEHFFAVSYSKPALRLQIGYGPIVQHVCTYYIVYIHYYTQNDLQIAPYRVICQTTTM